jgi:type II secretory pathway pseudopilin PulG
MRKIHQVMTSSRAAIDLASIMVGIIIIGLIGGVTAATVFAVIPWSQDKAAKQQLESIHTAENALYGLSSDASVTLQGGASRASFGSSTQLDANNLLTLDKTGSYCVIPATDGKDYHAYSKSGSGKWFSATNTQKSAVGYSGSTPCVNGVDTPIGDASQTPGTVDTGVDDGSGDVPTTPTTPTIPAPPAAVLVKSYDFENQSVSNFSYYNAKRSPETIAVVSGGHDASSKYSLRYIDTGESDDYFGGIMDRSYTSTSIVTGATYRMTAWVYWRSGTSVSSMNVSMFGSDYKTVMKTSPVTKVNTWTQVSFDVKATTNRTVAFSNYGRAYTAAEFLVDDVTIEKLP